MGIKGNAKTDLARRLTRPAVMCALLFLPLAAAARSPLLTCNFLDGANIYSSDHGELYLGFLGAEGARESIFNAAGYYGSRYTDISVRHYYGDYGSRFSTYSAANLHAMSPPAIRRWGLTVAYLTANPLIHNGISYEELATCSFTSLARQGFNGDTDGDGFIDEEDAFPLDRSEWLDTDDDGIGDNADEDDDGDGLTDTEEASLGTNSKLADTDGDGFSDGEEVRLGSDPKSGDSYPFLPSLNSRPWFRAILTPEPN